MNWKLHPKIVISIVLGIIILGLFYYFYRQQMIEEIEEEKIAELAEAKEYVGGLYSILFYHTFNTSISVKIVGNNLYFSQIKHFDEQNGICPACGIYGFQIVLPNYECIEIGEISYCPEQKKKFSVILKEIIPIKLYENISTILWVIRPIFIDNITGDVIDFDVEWIPSEDELTDMAEKNLTNVVALKDLEQKVNVIIAFPIISNKHCLEIPLSLTTNQNIVVEVPNSIENYSSSCEIVSSEKFSDNKLKIVVSCFYHDDILPKATICYK